MASPNVPDHRDHSPGSLSVVRAAATREKSAFETFIKITSDGSVTAFNGHVDLGTGIRTALGQIVAEELDVSFARIVVVLGDTSRVEVIGTTTDGVEGLRLCAQLRPDAAFLDKVNRPIAIVAPGGEPIRELL